VAASIFTFGWNMNVPTTSHAACLTRRNNMHDLIADHRHCSCYGAPSGRLVLALSGAGVVQITERGRLQTTGVSRHFQIEFKISAGVGEGCCRKFERFDAAHAGELRTQWPTPDVSGLDSFDTRGIGIS